MKKKGYNQNQMYHLVCLFKLQLIVNVQISLIFKTMFLHHFQLNIHIY